MVRRLAKPGENVLADLTPDKCHLWHMASCLLGEVVELLGGAADDNKDNVIEELGDIEFYLEGYVSLFGWDERLGDAPEKSIGLIFAAAELFDVTKKHVIYGKDLDQDAVVMAINQINFELLGVWEQFGCSRQEVLQASIAKLSKRYPTGEYQNADAIARADKGEGLGGKMVENVCPVCIGSGYEGPSVKCSRGCPPRVVCTANGPPTVNLMTGVLTGAGRTSKTAWAILLWLIVLFLLLLFMPGCAVEPARPMIHIPDRVEIHSIQEAAQPVTTRFQEDPNHGY